LHRGRNVVAVSALGEPSSRRMLASATLVTDDYKVRRIYTPDGCKARGVAEPGWTTAGFDDAAWTAMAAIGGTSTSEEVLTRRRIMRPALPDSYQLRLQ